MKFGEFGLNIADILTKLPLGIYCDRVDEDGRFWEDNGTEENTFYSANEAFYQCIGYEPEEFAKKGSRLRQILVADDRKRLQSKVEQAVKHPGTAYADVFEVIRRDGTASHIQWNAKYLKREGEMGYLLCSCMSVETFMKNESALINRLHKEKQERRKLNDLIYEMPVGVAVIKGGNDIRLDIANSEFLRAEGYSVTELLESKRPLTDYIYGADVGVFTDAVEICKDRKRTEELELRMITKSGQIHWELIQCRLYYYKDAIPYYILTSWDIDERKQLEDELRLLDEQYRMLEEVTDEFPFEYDVVQQHFRVPQKYHVNGKIPDWDKKYMILEEMLKDIYEEDRERFQETVLRAAQKEMTGSVDYRMNISTGEEEPVYTWYRTVFHSILGGNEQIIRIIGRSYDISSDRRIQEKLSEEMRLDPLTRLYNKVAVGDAVKEFISGKPNGTHVLFLIDIDNFKRINDTFGHTVGDTVISDIAQIINSQFRSTDVVGRIGGDEFLVFMKNTTMEDAVAKARMLCQETQKQLIGDDAIVSVTLSVGIAVYGVDGEDYGMLFEMADRAMYDTKRNGKNNFSFARRGEKTGYDGNRKERQVDAAFQRNQDADKEFLNFAFSLLSHAKDINGSLNVLIEQIGKKYGLDIVSVFEYEQQALEMTLTNYWSSFGPVYEKAVLPRTMIEFENAAPGEFVDIVEMDKKSGREILLESWNNGKEKLRHLAGIKFEFSGNRTGCLYVGVRQKEESFTASEVTTFCELGRVIAVFVSLRNKIRDDQKEIQHLQNRDKLTGLYNIEAFRRKTERILEAAAEEDREGGGKLVYALVHTDINHFSYVNENFGQQVGDSILREYADLIEQQDYVIHACRMYSDYFIMLVCGRSKEEIYHSIIEGNQVFEAQQKEKYPAGTMRLAAGICYVGEGEENFDLILEGANLARKQAKEQKNAGTAVYKEDMREKRDDEIQITGRFYGAIQKGEFEVFLQPKFLLGEKKLYGAEALARWRLKSGELMSPVKFIPPLENMGYVVDLDFYILEHLLRVMKRWKESGKELFTISTNFSRRNFENGGMDFIERLQEMMNRYQIDPRFIEIEVTESVIVENLGSLKECLSKLEELGHRIAIDDFGTGYSSLSVLLEIPADVIKIDKSFTDRIDLKEQREFVIQMGQFIRSAKEEVIFEGIEQEEQREFLMDCGFRYGQGFLFDRPLTIEEFERKYL